MSTLTLRSTKGSPLTNSEIDANFTALNTDKIEAAGVSYAQLNANSDVGPGATQVAKGDHLHTGVYEPAGASLDAAKSFAPHEVAVPDMTAVVDAGTLFSSITGFILQAQQTTSTITAPSGNPRIDRLAIDVDTGTLVVITGTEAPSPTAPAYLPNHYPICQVALVVLQTEILDSDITDERSLIWKNTLGNKGADIPYSLALTLGSDGDYFDITGDDAVISGATQANPCVITASTHGYTTGDTVRPRDVLGMTELNDNKYVITVLDANSFELDGINSTGFGAYTSGGVANPCISSIASIKVGAVIRLHFDGEVALVHHATNFVMLNGADFITAAGDEAIIIEYATGDWRLSNYYRASGFVDSDIAIGAAIATVKLASDAGIIEGMLANSAVSRRTLEEAVTGTLQTVPGAKSGNTSITSMTKLGEFKMVYGGTFETRFTLAGSNTTSVEGRVYVDDVAVGTFRSGNHSTPVQYTEDITITEGQRLQVYGRATSGNTVTINQFRAYEAEPRFII